MKYNQVEYIPDSAVSSIYNVTIPLSREESDLLRSSLAIVQKYQKIANQAVKNKTGHDPVKTSDWCEHSYSVKTDVVIISIRNGMAG